MSGAPIRVFWYGLLLSMLPVGRTVAQQSAPAARDSALALRNDSVNVRLVDVDLRSAAQLLSRYLDKAVLLSVVPTARVTLETPQPVPRRDVAKLLAAMLDAHGIELFLDSVGSVWRTRQKRADATVGVDVGALQAGGRSSAAQAAGPELHVIRLRHAKAAEVAQTVNALYGRAAALGEIGARASGASRSLPTGISSQGMPNVLAPPGGPAAPVGAGGAAGRPAVLTGELTIVPDANSNSLLVRAVRADADLVRAAVEQLDVRPLQVLIEVVIAELRRDRGLSFGTSAVVPQTQLPGRGNVTAGGRLEGGGAGDVLVRVLSSGGRVDLDATLRLGASRGDVTIISRPLIIATNNELAEILVGSQRPFIQVQRSLPTDAPQRDQVVQYRDVGTRLAVRPTISTDGYVMLDVTQEVNAATAETAFDAPVISTRLVQTRLLVRDSQTVALGGLTDRQRERAQSGLPVLSAIPFVGGLFGRSSRRTTGTELFVFITPHVLRSDDDAERATAPLRARTGRTHGNP